jgi:uncharacterized protein
MPEPTATLVCPKCQGVMRTYERSGVIIDQCTECRGIFLDRGELERLIDAEAALTEGAAPRPTADPSVRERVQPVGASERRRDDHDRDDDDDDDHWRERAPRTDRDGRDSYAPRGSENERGREPGKKSRSGFLSSLLELGGGGGD